MKNFAQSIVILGVSAIALGLSVAPALTTSQTSDNLSIAPLNRDGEGAILPQATAKSTESFFPNIGCGRLLDRGAIPMLLMDGAAKNSNSLGSPIQGGRNSIHSNNLREFGKGFCQQVESDRGLIPRW